MTTDATDQGDTRDTPDTSEAAARQAVKAAHRIMWALGDYPKLAKDVLADIGPDLVAACAVGPGQRVLDVAAGSGNAAVAAAESGATVVASDLTPELLEAGRRDAATRGLELEWVEADAESLPFEDGEFDVVLSAIGAIFAPDHQAVADELLRVCKPGGTIGMANWTMGGSIEGFLGVFAPYAPPPPPHAQPPILWGGEAHLRELFGDRVATLDITERQLPVDHFAEPQELVDYYKANFGPTVATYAHVADDAERLAALDRDFLAYAEAHIGAASGAVPFAYDYCLVVARKR